MSKILSIGIADFISVIAIQISTAICYVFLSDISTRAGKYEEVTAIWGVIVKIYSLICSVATGVNGGSLTTTSFANGAKDI